MEPRRQQECLPAGLLEAKGDIMQRKMILMAVATVFLLATCKRQVRVAAAPPESPASQGSQPIGGDPGREEMTIEGTLKPTVERGGWILETEGGQFLLLRLREFSSKPWFEVGAHLKARGKVDLEVITTFMQGTPFLVSHLELVKEPETKSQGQGLKS